MDTYVSGGSSRPTPVLQPTTQSVKPDGWIVITRRMLSKPAIPPYAYHYDYTHYDDWGDAAENFREIESDLASAREAVAIVPTLRGLPIGSTKEYP